MPHFHVAARALAPAAVFENDIDGVVVALGGKTSDVGDTMLTDGTNNVMAAMKAKGVKRISVVTSIGAGDSKVGISIPSLVDEYTPLTVVRARSGRRTRPPSPSSSS